MTSTRGILRTVGWTLLLGAVCGLGVIYAIEHLYGVPLTDTSFRFERPWFGVLFAGALLAFLARTWWFRFHAPRILMSRAHELHTAPKGWRTHLVPLAPALRTVALTLLCFGLMGPQSIHAKDTTEVEGIDIALVLDLSLSMQAADIRPNRFEATKEVVNEFIRRRPNDRIGAVLFGRDAYTLLPLTTDHEALSQMITELQLGSIDGRGTAIGNGVATALNRLRMSKAKSKVVILLTDGNSNSGNVSPDQAAEFASSLHVKVFTVLMGRSDDAPVQTAVDLFGRAIFDRGNFPVDPKLLRAMAKRTGGEAYEVSDRAGLERTFHTILDRLQKTKVDDPGKLYGELYPAFVWPALGLMLFELGLGVTILRRWP